MRDLIRTRWAAVGAAIAITLGAGGVSLTQAALNTSPRPVYVSLSSPCRVIDTRSTAKIGAGDDADLDVQITGENGACTDALAIPADAVGVSTNVTVILPALAVDGGSFFTVYPTGATRPVTSNLNFVNGQAPTPNKVDVGIGAGGKITIYNDDGAAHAAVDIFGYYIDHVHDDRYYQKSEVDAARPVSAFAGGDQQEQVATSPLSIIGTNPGETVRSVTITAPSAGTVTVNASLGAIGTEGGGQATTGRCSISATSGSLVSSATHSFTLGDGESATVSLTRGFAVSAGANTFHLVCATNGTIVPSINSFSMDVIDSQMTANFTAG